MSDVLIPVILAITCMTQIFMWSIRFFITPPEHRIRRGIGLALLILNSIMFALFMDHIAPPPLRMSVPIRAEQEGK